MSSPYINLRMLYNTFIQPLKDLALERYLMAASIRQGHSPTRGSAKKGRRGDQPLDIILNEQNPNHPTKIFSSTAIVQTRAFSAGTEHHGRTYQLGRRHTKSASTPGKFVAVTKLPKADKPSKRSRSASIPSRTSGGRGRSGTKSQQMVATILECSTDVSPRLGRDYIRSRIHSKSASPMLQVQSLKNHNTNRLESDSMGSESNDTVWHQQGLFSLKERLKDKWIVHNHQWRSMADFGLLHCFILAKNFKP